MGVRNSNVGGVLPRQLQIIPEPIQAGRVSLEALTKRDGQASNSSRSNRQDSSGSSWVGSEKEGALG